MATSHSGIFEIEDCLILMEIKSTAKKSEFSKLNQISQDLKKQNSLIITGLFCYNTEVSSKNIIESFGISFDENLEAYDTYTLEKDHFRQIDFCFSLNIDEGDYFNPETFFIRRDSFGKDKENELIKGIDGMAMRYFIETLKYEGASV